MKKITILAAALLGSVYFANAQVGIGTPTPNTSAMLDITANNKGVLIPRVTLTDASTALSGATTHENSLLVYNTNTASLGIEGKEVTPGFYYWFNGSWERITSQTDLENIIGETNQELENIINLLQTAYPSNNLDGSTSSGADLGGGMVYTPATGTEGEAGYVPAKIEYVYYNGTTYVKQDMTSLLNDLIEIQEGNVIYNPTTQVFQYWDGDSYEDISLEDIVQGFETKTSVVTIEGQQFYLAENFEGTIPATIPNPLPTGMYLIDVVGGVVNNFEDILNSNVVIEGEEYTIEEYIEYISQNAMQEGVTKIVITDGQASFQTWNNTTNTWESVSNASFSTIVKANESKTTVLEFPADSGKFYYISEAAIQANNNVVPTTPFSDGTSLLEGVVLLDIPGEVAQNFSTFLTEVTNIAGPNNTNLTVEQVIQNLIEEYSDANLPGTMVYTPGTNLTEASFTYTLADGTQSDAVTFSAIVKANQSLTDIAKTNTNNVINYVYTAEPALDGTARTFTIDLTQDLIEQITNNQNVQNAITNLTLGNGSVFYNGTGSAILVGGVSIPADTFYLINENGEGDAIDLGNIVVNEVVENFNTIVNSPVTVNGDTYPTVEEYIQHIAETSDANVGFTTTEITAANNPGGIAIPANSFYYINDEGVKIVIDLEDLVLANESKTGFITGTNTVGNTFIYYIGEEYLADNDFPTTTIANGWANSTDAPPAGVALLDIPQAVSTNFETILDQTTTMLIPGTTEEYYTVEEYIQYISERNGANVGYTTSEITAANNPGGEAIPENSFYYINDAGVKVIIPLGDIVYQGITQFTDNQVVEVKNILGDEIVVDTSVITGDTYKGSVVRRGVYTTTITANTANTTGVTLDVDASEIISITVKYNGGLVANVTDLTVSGSAVAFRIGTGNMYQVLGNTDIVAEVIIEFTTNE